MREPAPRWPMFQEVLRRGRLLERMLSALGISASIAAREGNGEAIAAARSTCISCPHTRACEAWLERTHSLNGDAGKRVAPRFCPNAGYLTACLDHAAAKSCVKG